MATLRMTIVGNKNLTPREIYINEDTMLTSESKNRMRFPALVDAQS